MCSLIEYTDVYSKTSGSLWQYYRDEPVLNNNDEIIDFPADYNSASFKFKHQITGKIGKGGTKHVERMVPLKCVSNFWGALEIPLINCQISLLLKWFRNCIRVAGTKANQNLTFQINETKLYVPFVTLSTQEHIKLLEQLESGFKRAINWKKYLTKTTNQEQNKYLHILIDPNFQVVNRLFVLSFKDNNV